MATSPSPFIWYELMTTDTAAAEVFYRGVIGWRTQDAGMPGLKYTLLSAGEVSVGVSVGAAHAWPGDRLDRAILIARADTAMYAGKTARAA